MSVVAHIPNGMTRETRQIHIPEDLHKALRRRAAELDSTLFDVSKDVISKGLAADQVVMAPPSN